MPSITKQLIAPSGNPDQRILNHVRVVQTACLIMVGLIAGAILFGWLLPVFGAMLPHGWSQMKANSALGFLLGAGSLALTDTTQTSTARMQGKVFGVATMVIAGAALFAYSAGHTTMLETLLADDSGAETPGRMSIQTGIYLSIAGLILVFEGPRQKHWSYLVDALTLALVLLVLSILAGYLFGMAGLFGPTPYTLGSPQSLLCMVCLSVVVVSRRTRHGFFSVLVGEAIGSQAARLALPVALLLPFLIVSATAYSTHAHWISAPYAAALASSSCAVLIFALVVLMARRINDLERELRDVSLTDELTKIHNRRAFYLLGEHALREAHRLNKTLTVLFFDLNGLKKINDTLGHDVGSRLLVEAASLLRTNFRSSDVVARIGGDEFAVVTQSRKSELVTALKRLDDATAAANKSHGDYRVSYSMGEASVEPHSHESFVQLVARADAKMYGRKRQRTAERDGRAATDSHATGVMAAYVSQDKPH
jgi:diguanylate cyclase (GGDEF)-like protein